MWSRNIKTATAYWAGWFLCMCLIMYFDTIDEYRNSEKVKGQVVRVLQKATRRQRGPYPEFEFSYKDSSFFFDKRNGLFVATWHVGDKATVIFPAGAPDKAEVYSFFSYWVSLTNLFFGFMIALFVFVVPVFFRWQAEFKEEQKRMQQRP